jgi:hypothetical protein
MKEFLRADSGVNKLFEMVLYTPMYSRILSAGIELGIFTELQESKNHTEIAQKLSLHPNNTGYLLDALAAMELLEKKEGAYKNTALTEKHLVRGYDSYLGEYLRTYSRVSGFENVDIIKLVKEGPASVYQDKEGMEAHDVFGDYTEFVKSSQRAGRAKEIADIVASLPEFGGFNKMLDLGGGPGLIGMAVVQAHPVMKGVIFETPAVGKTAEEAVTEYNLEGRVEVLTGDYMKDSIGEGYDLILAIGTLNFAKHDLDAVIKKIYDALNPQGVFICISEGLTHEKTRPKLMVGWLPSFLQGCDFSLAQGEISDAALRNGFRSVYKRTMDLIMGEMDVDIARK